MLRPTELNTFSMTSTTYRDLVCRANRGIGLSGKTPVVIIYCNIFLPLLLTILSVYVVPLLPLSCVTIPLSLTP